MLKAYSFVPHLYSLLIGKFLRLYGLKTGKNVYISSGTILDSYLVSIGSGSLIGVRAIISAHITEKNHLILGPVTIGENVTIGGNSIIAPGATIGDNVIIGVNSLVIKDQKIPSNTVYGGTPARLIRKIDGTES
jgi:maltose O-acetyltransferase